MSAGAKKVCFHMKVKGKVQGVGFRDHTYQAAKKMGGLSGWVRNLDNGDVEILVQGDGAKVKQFMEWVHQGPTNARIDMIDEKEVRVEDALTSFAIRKF